MLLFNPAPIGMGIIPACKQASCASLTLMLSSESIGSPPYGDSSDIGNTIRIAVGLGFQRWSNVVGGSAAKPVLPWLSRYDRQAQLDAGPHISE